MIEKSLSVDNLFVFLLIFSFFAVPRAYQYRVLLWGVIGAMVVGAGAYALITSAVLTARRDRQAEEV